MFRPVFAPETVESDTLGCSARVIPHITNQDSDWSSERPIISFMLAGDREVVVQLMWISGRFEAIPASSFMLMASINSSVGDESCDESEQR